MVYVAPSGSGRTTYRSEVSCVTTRGSEALAMTASGRTNCEPGLNSVVLYWDSSKTLGGVAPQHGRVFAAVEIGPLGVLI